MTSGPQQPWYTDFFTELPNELWRAAVPPQQTLGEVDFLERIGRPAGGSVLDVACGSGRHLLELARRGHPVRGIDLSTEAIGFARAAARAEDLPVDLMIGDMADLPAIDLAPPHSLITCLGNAFGYLPHAQTVRFLATTHGLLDAAGALIIDTGFVAESFLPGLHLQEEPMTIGGVEMTSVNSYDPVESRFLTEMTFRRGSEVHRGTSVQHVYTSAEMARLCRAAGYGDVELYGDVDGSPYRWGSSRLLLVARA